MFSRGVQRYDGVVYAMQEKIVEGITSGIMCRRRVLRIWQWEEQLFITGRTINLHSALQYCTSHQLLHRKASKVSISYTHTSAISDISMTLACWRKPQYPEETHSTGRTYQLHADSVLAEILTRDPSATMQKC